jgi:hypothetical protein
MGEIHAHGYDPTKRCHKPRITFSPVWSAKDQGSPSYIHEKKNYENWKNAESPDERFSRDRVNSCRTLRWYSPTERSAMHVDGCADYIEKSKDRVSRLSISEWGCLGEPGEL